MNELETIIHEVHDSLINGTVLSSDITVGTISFYGVIITYGNYIIELNERVFILKDSQYHWRYENYVLDKDCHFEQSLMNDTICNCETINKMVQIRNFYRFDTFTSTEFLTEFNEAE